MHEEQFDRPTKETRDIEKLGRAVLSPVPLTFGELQRAVENALALGIRTEDILYALWDGNWRCTLRQTIKEAAEAHRIGKVRR